MFWGHEHGRRATAPARLITNGQLLKRFYFDTRVTNSWPLSDPVSSKKIYHIIEFCYDTVNGITLKPMTLYAFVFQRRYTERNRDMRMLTQYAGWHYIRATPYAGLIVLSNVDIAITTNIYVHSNKFSTTNTYHWWEFGPTYLLSSMANLGEQLHLLLAWI